LRLHFAQLDRHCRQVFFDIAVFRIRIVWQGGAGGRIFRKKGKSALANRNVSAAISAPQIIVMSIKPSIASTT
jgi:hypothetical protein